MRRHRDPVGDVFIASECSATSASNLEWVCRTLLRAEAERAREQGRSIYEVCSDLAVDPATEDLAAIVRQRTDGLGADVALRLVRRRGRVSLFAGFSVGDSAPLDINLIHYGELVLTGAFGLSRLNSERALDLLARQRIDVAPFVTHRYGLSAIAEALAMAEKGAAIKVAIVSDWPWPCPSRSWTAPMPVRHARRSPPRTILS